MAKSGKSLIGTLLAVLLLASVRGQAEVVAPKLKILLVAAGDSTYTAKGLTALRIPHERISTQQFRGISPFDYDLIIWGCDEDRSVLGADPQQISSFVQDGGFFLGFRQNAPDPWLPVPTKRDKAYEFGQVLTPDHPIFNLPNQMEHGDLLDVHGGSIYDAFAELGEGWVPLLNTGRDQRWDKRQAGSAETYYGVVELKYGTGHILLTQMLPAYHWFHDSDGKDDVAGAKFFRNIVTYAISQAPVKAASRPPRLVPSDFRQSISELISIPKRGDGIPFVDNGWTFRAQGPYTKTTDRRGVLTLTHADKPSQAGNFAELRKIIPIPKGAATLSLRWYLSDTYCGGRERILGGKEHGKTAANNFKKGLRFAQVLVNNSLAWEQDVLGRNPQPARSRFYTVDVSAAAEADQDTIEIALRVEDREGSGEEPFAIDVFWATVELSSNQTRLTAAKAFAATGFAALDNGVLRLQEDQGTLTHTFVGETGEYLVALNLRDGTGGQSKLHVVAGRRTIAKWQLTADDSRQYWATTKPVKLSSGTRLQISAQRDSAERVEISHLAIIPAKHTVSTSATKMRPPAKSKPTRRVSFPVTIRETAGVDRTAEITAQGMPFPQGCLKDVSQITISDADSNPVPVQTRTIAAWPDGSTKVALVCFPATVAGRATSAYTVAAGRGVKPHPAIDKISISDEGGLLRIDTGPIAVTVSTTHGRLVEEIRRGNDILKEASTLWDLSIEDETGRLLRSAAATVTETRIVDQGPLRALIVRKGNFADSAGQMIEYRLQLEATAGSAALNLSAIIVNREDSPEIYLKRWSMLLNHARAQSGRAWLTDNESCAADEQAVLYQHRENCLTWTGRDGARSRVEAQSPGYVQLPGVLVGTRWFWQRFPQAIRFTEDQVRFDFIPAAFDEQDLPTPWAERMQAGSRQLPA